MLGLIKKDIFVLKNNLKILIFLLAFYIFFGITNNVDISAFIPFITTMICISTFNYDEFNNWNAYAITLPTGRANIVKSKYISTIILIALSGILGLILSFTICYFKNTLNIENTFSSFIGGLFAITILISILFPILIKFGAEKGRIALFVLTLAILAIATFGAKYLQINISNNIINLFNNYWQYILIIVSTIFLYISFLISKKIYSKKEF